MSFTINRKQLETELSPQERWLSVVNYEDRYEVSNMGRVRSLIDSKQRKREVPLILKAGIGDAGYPQVVLHRKGSPPKTITVHSLILTAFVGPRPKGYQCAHLDGCRANSVLNNLRWVTGSENQLHRDLHGTSTRGETASWAKLTDVKVRTMRQRYALGDIGIRTLAKEYGMSYHPTRMALIGKTWSHVK